MVRARMPIRVLGVVQDVPEVEVEQLPIVLREAGIAAACNIPKPKVGSSSLPGIAIKSMT
jgi:hypothetical protein